MSLCSSLVDQGLYPTAEVAARGYDRAILKVHKARTDLNFANFADAQLSGSDHGEVCEDGGELLCCDNCSRVFHLSCLEPPLVAVLRASWHCALCSLALGKCRSQACPFCGAGDMTDTADMRLHFAQQCRQLRRASGGSTGSSGGGGGKEGDSSKRDSAAGGSGGGRAAASAASPSSGNRCDTRLSPAQTPTRLRRRSAI